MTTDSVKTLIQAATGHEATDESLLAYLLQAEQQALLADCNLEALPEALEPVVEERAAGRYLQIKKQDVLSDDELKVVTRIVEGDSTVELGGTTAESRLDSLIAEWLRERDVSCYRKLRW